MTKITTPVKFTDGILADLEHCLIALTSVVAAGKRHREAVACFAQLKALGCPDGVAVDGSRLAGDLADSQARSLRNTIAEAKRQIELDNDINVSMALISTPDHVFSLGDEVRIREIPARGYGGNLKYGDVVLISSLADKGKSIRCNNELGNCWIDLMSIELVKAVSVPEDFKLGQFVKIITETGGVYGGDYKVGDVAPITRLEGNGVELDCEGKTVLDCWIPVSCIEVEVPPQLTTTVRTNLKK